MKNNKIKNYKGGYTIIETMIAVSIFIVIIITGMGALLNANLLHQKSRDQRSIMDNLSFVMEDMSRNLRTGASYHCMTTLNFSTLATPASCRTGIGIAFKSTAQGSATPWVYYLDSGKLYKSTDGGISFVQLTPDEAVIDGNASNISVLGAEAPATGDQQQPFVTIRLVGTITYKTSITPFSLQTSVSQRLLDL